MRSNGPRDTGPELALRRALRAAGVHGYRVDYAGARGRPDVAFPRERLAVFVHGCFWHRCPRCAGRAPRRHARFWREKFARNVARDREVREALVADGWGVIEFWEHQVGTPEGAAHAANVVRFVRRVRRAFG